MKHYYVYILRCNDKSYYTGVTSNLEGRLIQHEDRKYHRSYTASRLPVELVFWERFYNPVHAIDFEKQVKGWSRNKKEALIKRNWHKLKELSVCRNHTHHALHSFGCAPPGLDSTEPGFDFAQPDFPA